MEHWWWLIGEWYEKEWRAWGRQTNYCENVKEAGNNIAKGEFTKATNVGQAGKNLKNKTRAGQMLQGAAGGMGMEAVEVAV